MKHQYYADSRDVWKWSVLVRLARQYNLHTILQIAMLTPNESSSHGMQRDSTPGADSTVMKFFDEERLVVDADPSLKRIERIVRLGSLFKLPLSIKVASDPFGNLNRGKYFKDMCSRIQSEGRPIVVFVDPDIGMATEAMRSPSEKHVTEQDLKAVWSAMIPGSPLVVYQHRRSIWLDEARERLARMVDLQPESIYDSASPAVWFLNVLK